jgi:hypothetical protein
MERMSNLDINNPNAVTMTRRKRSDADYLKDCRWMRADGSVSKRDLWTRFWAKIVILEGRGCFLWQGYRTPDGYGILRFNGRMVGAHRAAWMMMRGQIPEGLTIDHLCRVPACVNPDHMEVVSNRTNILRGNATSAINARKTHCLKGHPLAHPNLYIDSRGHRTCKRCAKHRAAESYREATHV